MHEVKTDHQIVPFGDHEMSLFDNNGGISIVSATRPDINEAWTIHADGIDDVTAETRSAAITAMVEHALTVCPGEGYSTLVPHGLSESP